MSNTPKIDRFYGIIEEKCLPLDARYYHMRTYARKIELELHEQCRLLGMSAERECDLRGKVDRERALADRLHGALDALDYNLAFAENAAHGSIREKITIMRSIALPAINEWKEARSE